MSQLIVGADGNIELHLVFSEPLVAPGSYLPHSIRRSLPNNGDIGDVGRPEFNGAVVTFKCTSPWLNDNRQQVLELPAAIKKRAQNNEQLFPGVPRDRIAKLNYYFTQQKPQLDEHGNAMGLNWDELGQSTQRSTAASSAQTATDEHEELFKQLNGTIVRLCAKAAVNPHRQPLLFRSNHPAPLERMLDRLFAICGDYHDGKQSQGHIWNSFAEEIDSLIIINELAASVRLLKKYVLADDILNQLLQTAEQLMD